MYVIVLLLLIAFAPSASAQQSTDVLKVCEPILLNASVKSIEKRESSLLFKHFITMLYQKRDESLESVEKQGFDLSIVVEGVPISALWSSDSSTRQKAETIYSKFVDNTLLSKKTTEFKEVSDNSFAMAEYNRCVIQMTSSSSPLTCYFSAEAERENTVLHVLFRPSFTISDTRVKIAKINNGFVPVSDVKYNQLSKKQQNAYTTAMEQLGKGQKISIVPPGASATLKVPNGRLDTGIYSFTIYRLDPDKKVSIDLLWQNNLGCSPSAEPVAKSEITATIWPTGRDWVAATDHFEFAQTSGCSKDWFRQNSQFCVSGQAKITSIDPPHTWSANCDAEFTGAVIKPGTDNCIIASGRVGGCGTGQVGDCKGRGWVKTTIIVQKTVPGAGYEPERFITTDTSLEGSWTKLFSYGGTLPTGFKADGWKYTVQIARQLTSGTETLVLTESDPEQGNCRAKLTSGDKEARVVVACGAPTAAAALLK